MFKKKSKSNRSPSSSYVSNFSDRELHNFGSTKVPRLVIEDTESLWDFRKPITLRIHKVKAISRTSLIDDMATISVKSLPNRSSYISDVRQETFDISVQSVKSAPNKLLDTKDIPQKISNISVESVLNISQVISDVLQEISDISVENISNETQSIFNIPQEISKISVKSMLNESQDIWNIQQDISNEISPNKSLNIQNIQQNISHILIKSQLNESTLNELQEIRDQQNIISEKINTFSSIKNVLNKSMVNNYQQTSMTNLRWILTTLPVSIYYI